MTEEIQKDNRNSQVLLIWDRLLDTFDLVMNKIISARWIVTVFIIFTYCACVFGTLYLVIKAKADIAVFLAVFTPFAVLAKEMIEAYFKRNDRGGSNDKDIPSTS